MKPKKAQASVEYILLFAFIALLMMIMSYWIYDYYQVYDEKIVSARVEDIARKLTTTSEKIHYFGPPSQTTVDVNMPGRVIEMSTHINDLSTGCTECTELRFKLGYENQPEVIYSSRIKIIPCNGRIDQAEYIFPDKYFSQGAKAFEIKSKYGQTKADNYIEVCMSE